MDNTTWGAINNNRINSNIIQRYSLGLILSNIEDKIKEITLENIEISYDDETANTKYNSEQDQLWKDLLLIIFNIINLWKATKIKISAIGSILYIEDNGNEINHTHSEINTEIRTNYENWKNTTRIVLDTIDHSKKEQETENVKWLAQQALWMIWGKDLSQKDERYLKDIEKNKRKRKEKIFAIYSDAWVEDIDVNFLDNLLRKSSFGKTHDEYSDLEVQYKRDLQNKSLSKVKEIEDKGIIKNIQELEMQECLTQNHIHEIIIYLYSELLKIEEEKRRRIISGDQGKDQNAEKWYTPELLKEIEKSYWSLKIHNIERVMSFFDIDKFEISKYNLKYQSLLEETTNKKRKKKVTRVIELLYKQNPELHSYHKDFMIILALKLIDDQINSVKELFQSEWIKCNEKMINDMYSEHNADYYLSNFYTWTTPEDFQKLCDIQDIERKVNTLTLLNETQLACIHGNLIKEKYIQLLSEKNKNKREKENKKKNKKFKRSIKSVIWITSIAVLSLFAKEKISEPNTNKEESEITTSDIKKINKQASNIIIPKIDETEKPVIIVKKSLPDTQNNTPLNTNVVKPIKEKIATIIKPSAKINRNKNYSKLEIKNKIWELDKMINYWEWMNQAIIYSKSIFNINEK